MAALYIEIPSFYSALAPTELTRNYQTLLARLGINTADIELSFGVSYETARKWEKGICPPPVSAVVALAAIESLDADERGAFIARRVKKLADNPAAVAERERKARKAELAAELAARPPLSAKQANRRTSR